MVERIISLLATQGPRVRFLVPARLTFRVKKVALFYNPVSGGTFSSTAIEIIKCVWVKQIAVAQAKVSHILRPGNTAFKEHLKLVNGFERYYRRIHALKKKKTMLDKAEQSSVYSRSSHWTRK
jgi:hypothetical protein